MESRQVVAPIAVGGLAVGWYAAGGAAIGVHAYGGFARDPIAREFFKHWTGAGPLFGSLALMLVMTATSILVPWLVHRRMLKRSRRHTEFGFDPLIIANSGMVRYKMASHISVD